MLWMLVGCLQYRLDNDVQRFFDTGFQYEGDGYTAWLIPAGTFMMGCEQSDCYADERPSREVTISRDFYMMESEVIQDLYERVMSSNPSNLSGSLRPVDNVSWYDAVEFANALSVRMGLRECYTISDDSVSWSNPDCAGWRLPTEAEWEYAARGGQSYKYAGSDTVDAVAWYYTNSNGQAHDVCGKQANGYGLCDMSGNVWEWVWDWYDSDYYSSSPTVDPQGPTSGSGRVRRGGGWGGGARSVRASERNSYGPTGTGNDLGFRLVRISP